MQESSRNKKTDFVEVALTSGMTITDKEFRQIRDLIYENFGISLGDQKRSLVVGRLQKLLRSLHLTTFTEYLNYLKTEKSGMALAELVNLISTNHTFFFREKEHFNFLEQTILPEIVASHKASNNKDLRVWCAAASSGEEPYTIAMTMMDYFGDKYANWNAGLLATDISAKALALAEAGVYPKERVQEIPVKLRNTYFTKGLDGSWHVKDVLKREITFRRLNLMNTIFPFKHSFDIIFCRNVMIYFDQETREALAQRLANVMSPGAYLLIGHSESLRGNGMFEYIMPAVYRKV